MRAENGTQTRDPQLGRLVLYRLSYFREMLRLTPNGAPENFNFWGERRQWCALCRMATSVAPFAERVGADGFEPPKLKSSRFTVCPIWPLWNTPFVATRLRRRNAMLAFRSPRLLLSKSQISATASISDFGFH